MFGWSRQRTHCPCKRRVESANADAGWRLGPSGLWAIADQEFATARPCDACCPRHLLSEAPCGFDDSRADATIPDGASSQVSAALLMVSRWPACSLVPRSVLHVDRDAETRSVILTGTGAPPETS